MKMKNCVVIALFVGITFLMPAAEVVKGKVRLVTIPSPLEYAEAYERSSEPWLRQSMYDLRKKQENQGIDGGLVPVNAIVELQTLPGFIVIARAKVDKDGRYVMTVEDDDRDWRVFCKCELAEFGKKVEFVASAHVEWNKRENAYVQDLCLRRDGVSVIGRCVDVNGVPVVNAVVRVGMITTPSETSETIYHDHVARSDKNGRWRVDGVRVPSFDRLVSYVCNTNVISVHDSACPPYRISVTAEKGYMSKNGPLASVAVANVSDNGHVAATRYFAAYKRKTGKECPRPNPLADFPVSTNNVIYIPDLVMK